MGSGYKDGEGNVATHPMKRQDSKYLRLLPTGISFPSKNRNSMARFITKRINSMKPQKRNEVVVENNNINEQVMTTSEKIAMAQNVLNGEEVSAPVKRVKKDKGLIERTESSKTILTEDNKELLND